MYHFCVRRNSRYEETVTMYEETVRTKKWYRLFVCTISVYKEMVRICMSQADNSILASLVLSTYSYANIGRIIGTILKG